MDNLDTRGVLFRPTFVLVHRTHPVVRVLADNADLIGVDVAHHLSENSEWYKLTHRCFNGVSNVIRRGQCAPPPTGPEG